MIPITEPVNEQALAEMIQRIRGLLGDQQDGPDVLATLTNCIVTEPLAQRETDRYYAAIAKAKALIDTPC